MNANDPKILVVDDDAEMASVLCDVLRDAGYSAMSANSGAQALAMVEGDEPDLVITDLRMSQMDGHQLQTELKRRLPNLSVIVITAFGSIANAVESMKLGAFDYLTKPFGNDEFLLVVSRALENRDLRREVRRLRGELANGRGPGDHPAGGRHARYRAAAGRERHRQGTARAPAAFRKRAARSAVRANQLLGHPGKPDRERAVRLRQGRLHGCAREQGRTLSGGPGRHSLPR